MAGPRKVLQARGPQANPKAAIQDWLTLVDPDGAFLTTTELAAVFPHGFEPMPADHRTELRARIADLNDGAADRVELRTWLLETALDWGDQLVGGQAIPATASVRAPEHGVQLRPDLVLLDVDDTNKTRLGVFVWPLGTRLDRRADVTVSGDTWPASPIQRAETWCRESGIPLALVTDDDQWSLVWAPRGAPAASCRWRVGDLADERILQSGFVALLGARRFFAVADDETLEKLFERAANAEAEVTKGLGTSVRRSVELLVAAISRDDVASSGAVLDGVASTEVYESAVTVLMRLVFLLFAEERRLLPAEDPLWAESYSVLTLRDDLRTSSVRDGEDALERRSTAWHRLLATFRAVHGGVNHDRLTLPAYGGSLFNPDRFPFLEGRRAPDHLTVNDVDLGPAPDAVTGPERPVAIDDRTVLAILDALLTVEVKSGRTKVAQRVSYKALDVEQIGHCYEGLLDHGCAPVDVLAVGLFGPEGNEPEITITDLEAHLADGPDAMCEWLSDKTLCNKKSSALEQLLVTEPSGVDLARLRVACGHDDDTVARVLPFWGLIRADLRGLPVVLLPGSQFVTQTSTRRNMGAQYTTKALAEEVVQYALEPLVYEPGPQNEADPTKWKLRTPGEILGLRVCDPAVGSGAILTAAGRYLADRLVESVVEYGPGVGPFAGRLADLAQALPEEQVILARREIVDHCLYGVDKNPVAAEMAKLSLWLTTMARERPFTFLDHAIQVGDALLGITDMEQLRWLHLDPSERMGTRGFESVAIDLRLKEAVELARRLQELSVITVRDATEKQRLHDELRGNLADLSVVADAVVGAALSTAGRVGISMEQRLDTQLDRIRAALDLDRPSIERVAALNTLYGVSTGWLRADLPDEEPNSWDRQCLHWPLAFPEVFLEGDLRGFHAVVGNPPFLGGKRISTVNGSAYEAFLKTQLGGAKGAADLSAHFLRRAARVSRPSGTLGLITTDRISQGDTAELGLKALLLDGMTIYRAWSSETWPGSADVMIARPFLIHGPWSGQRLLDDEICLEISAALRSNGEDPEVHARVLHGDGLVVSTGTYVYGEGFVLSPQQADALLDPDSPERLRLSPYLIASDLTGGVDLASSRLVIDFTDIAREQDLELFPALYRHIQETVKPVRHALTGQIHQPHYWKFWDLRPELYAATSSLRSVIVCPRVAQVITFARVDARQIFGDRVVVFASDNVALLSVLQSVVHSTWIDRFRTDMGKAPTYVVGKCFRTFPLINYSNSVELEAVGARYEACRATAMTDHQVGLTKLQALVSNEGLNTPSIAGLRLAQTALDEATVRAYGWSDIRLDHDFRRGNLGVRYCASPIAGAEILRRLLNLNHERYEAELAAGLHAKKVRGASVRRSAKALNPSQETLL